MEDQMFALVPVVGGLLLGWLAPRRVAIAAQAVLYAIAVTVLTLTAPEHGGHYTDGIVIGLGLAVVSTATLVLGFWLARRRTNTRS
jgi:hypothetical protein